MIIMAGNPPMSPRSGKYMACRVHLLDGSMQIFHVPFKSMGQVLFDEVVRHVQLLEADYFDLEYMTVEKLAAWLDREKLILKQVTPNNLIFRFLVKFYTPDPVFLEDEYTRYLFALQIKQDLASGSLYCQEHTAVLLASYIVQAEMGDFVEEEYPDHSYLLDSHLLPNQTAEILAKIMEHHREHVGFSPAEADFNLLDTARKVEFYGIRLHPARDHENVCLDLAVTHMGVLVFQNKVKINTFSWAKIRKLSFKRRKFLIKLHQEGYGFYKDTVEFYFDNRNGSKNFWKKCIEHHSFFRCHAVKRMPRHKTRVVSRGSSFRYTGRTQKQLVEWMRENYLKRPPFERSPDKLRRSATTGQVSSCSELLSHQQANRSTSLRTVSTSRSVGATPKTGTLNSRDFQPSRNTSASSGSHILDTRRSFENVRMIADDRLAANPAMNSSLPLHQLDTANDPLVSGALQLAAYDLSFNADIIDSSHLLLMSQNANDNDDTSHDSYHLNESQDSLDGELDSDSDNCKQSKEDFLNHFNLVDKLYGDMLLNVENQNTPELSTDNGLLESACVVSSDANNINEFIVSESNDGTEPQINVDHTLLDLVNVNNERYCVSSLPVVCTEDAVNNLAVVELLFDKVLETDDNGPSAAVEESIANVPVANRSCEDVDTQPLYITSESQVTSLSADVNDSTASVVGGRLEKQETIKSLEDGEDLNNEIPYILHRRHISPVANQRIPLKEGVFVQTSTNQLADCASGVLRQKQSVQLQDSVLSSLRHVRGRSKSPSVHAKGTYDFVLRSKLPSRYSYSSRDDTFNGSTMPSINVTKSEVHVANETNMCVDTVDSFISVTETDFQRSGEVTNQGCSCGLVGDFVDKFTSAASNDVALTYESCENNGVSEVSMCAESSVDDISSAVHEVRCCTKSSQNHALPEINADTAVGPPSCIPSTQTLELTCSCAAVECMPLLGSSEPQLSVPDIVIRSATPLSSVCELETIPFIDDSTTVEQDSVNDFVCAPYCFVGNTVGSNSTVNFTANGDIEQKFEFLEDASMHSGATVGLCDVLLECEVTSDIVNYQMTEATLVQMKEICDISPSDSELSVSSESNLCSHLTEITEEDMEPLAILESKSDDSISSSLEEFDMHCELNDQCESEAVVECCWEDYNCVVATEDVANSASVFEKVTAVEPERFTSLQIAGNLGVFDVLESCNDKSIILASAAGKSDVAQCVRGNEACDASLVHLNQMDEKMRRSKFAASRDSIQHYNLVSANVISSGSSSEDNGSCTEEAEPLEILENNVSQHCSSDDDDLPL